MAINVEQHTFRSPQLIQIAKSAVLLLKQSPQFELPPKNMVAGSGVYALYYTGELKKYSTQSKHGAPIYVGKAVPSGWRTATKPAVQNEPKLRTRLNEHVNSIKNVKNLDIGDFKCRFIIFPPDETILIPVVESELIKTLRPVWNTNIDGFGNHDPGKGRYKQARSEWDRMHPGRPWADKLPG